jgi:hypothetical protein
MSLGREPILASGIDPLFAPVFIVAAILNLAPVLMPGVQWSVPIRQIPRGLTGLWFLVAVIAHVAFFIRVSRASAYASGPRDVIAIRQPRN